MPLARLVAAVAGPGDAGNRGFGQKELLPRYLTVNPYVEDLHEAPPPFVMACKSGAVNGVRNDVALITSGDKSLVISAYSRVCPDTNWTPANIGAEAIARVGKLLCDCILT